MPKKRNDNEIWGENEAWGGDDEGWDYKPPQQDIRSRTASQRREYAERNSKQPSGDHPGREKFDYGRPERERPVRERPGERYGSRPDRGRPGGHNSFSGGRGGPPPYRGKSKIVYFYIGTLLVAVVICLFLFAMAFQTITSERGASAGSSPEPSEITAEATADPSSILEERDVSQFTGMITALGPLSNSVTVLDIDNRRDRTFEVLENTSIKDRYSTAIVYSELQEGMLLDVEYQTQTEALVSLAESTRAWELAYKTNVEVDVETSKITIGNEEYSYNSRTLITYKGEPYPVSQITDMDTVSLTGFGADVWSVQLEGGHGFLEIENADAIIDGSVSVGTFHMFLADISEPITLAEGPHRVIVEGQNIEVFTQDISIAQNETTTVSLINAELKPGTLLITSSEPDSEIFIDGVAVTEPGPVEISFGQHVVRVEKDQFTPVEQIVDINKTYQELSVILTRLEDNASITITTHPTPAQIYIDSVYVGQSPWTQRISTGPHIVVARLEGFNDSPPITVDVVEDGNNSRHLLLMPLTTDPTDRLPAPTDAQPIIDEPVNDMPPDPYAPPTATPVPPSSAPAGTYPGTDIIPPPGGALTGTPTPPVTAPTPTPPAAVPNTVPTPAPPVTEPTPTPPSAGPVFEEEFTA